MNNKKNLIIVGGGIAGLYLGYNLLDTYRVTILEKSNRLGGRILTRNYRGFSFESGAGRFSRCHTNLYKLLENLDFKDKMIPIKKEPNVKTLFRKINITDINYYYDKIFEDYEDFFPKGQKSPAISSKGGILEEIKKDTKYLSSISTYDYLMTKLSIEEFEDFISIYPFIGDIKFSNALCGLNILACEYNTKQFYVLNGGLEQFVKKLENLYVSKGGIIELNKEITHLFKNNNNNYVLLDKENNEYRSDIVVLSMTPMNLQKLNPDTSYFPFLKYLKTIPLLRLYFYYDKPQKSLEGLNKTVSDLDIHFTLPMNNQMIMISYTDSDLAKLWFNLYHTDRDEFYNKILSEFSMIYGVILEKPSKVFFEYWEDGMFVWKSGYDYISNKNEILNPASDLFLCNEGFSDKQGWIEGSLRMANDVLKKIK